MAHRGGAGLAPENTLEAFRSAVDLWEADVLEMDVRASSDGEVVVIHDATVARTCDGAGVVAEMPWAELRELDAGYHFTDPEGAHSFRGEGVRIPRFEEVLDAFPETRVNVDAKCPEACPGLVDAIRRHGARDRVLIAASSERHRAAARGYGGPWGASRRQIRWFWIAQKLGVAGLVPLGADALQVPETWKGRRVVSPGFVEAAHALNIPVHVWTVDDEADMRRLLSWGVDGIQTDRPDRLARVLADVADRPPPPGLSGAAGDGPAAAPGR